MSKEYIEREALIKSIVNTPSVACQCAWKTGAHTFTETLNRLAERQHEIIDMITSAPKADVAEMVRCAECKGAIPLQHSDYVVCCGCRKMPKTGFCSYGERKEINNDT